MLNRKQECHHEQHVCNWDQAAIGRLFQKLSRMADDIERVVHSVYLLNKRGEILMATVQELTDVITQVQTDVASVVALVGTLGDQITALQAAVANDIDPAALDADLQSLKDTATAIEAALPAPVVPVPEPTPEPVPDPEPTPVDPTV